MRLRVVLFELSYCIAVLLVFVFVFFNVHPFGDTWVIPDSYSLLNTAKETQNISFIDLFDTYKSSWLLFAFNKIIYSLSSVGFVFSNIIFVLISFFYFDREARFGVFVLVMTPFFLLSIPLPSKDIAVLLLFSIWCESLKNNRGLLRLLFISFLMFLVRDGFGLILVCLSLQGRFVFLDKINPYLHILIIFVFGFLFSEVLSYFTDDFFLLARVSSIVEQFQQVNYPLRVFGTLTNFAARNPILTSSGTLNVVFFCYALSGVMVICSAIVSMRMLCSTVESDRKLAISFFSALLLISMSPLVQSRYMVSLVVILTCYKSISLIEFLKSYAVSIFLSLCLFGSYCLLDALPDNPPPENANMSVFY